MRIISGKYKGRRISPPKNLPVRPTTDVAKEGLFNTLFTRMDFENLEVLDLFSGTGNISFEFASRGVSMVTAVDKNIKCNDFLHKVKKELQMDNLRPVKSDALRFLELSSEKWDIIFADPPYDYEQHQKIPEIVFENDLLAEDGYLIIEHAAETSFTGHPHLEIQKTYSRVNFSLFRKTTE